MKKKTIKIKTVRGWKTPKEILLTEYYIKNLIMRFRKVDLSR